MGQDKDTGADRQAKLYELTSQTGLPTMFHDQERPAMSGLSNLRSPRESARKVVLFCYQKFRGESRCVGLCAIVLERMVSPGTRILNDSPLLKSMVLARKQAQLLHQVGRDIKVN